ncbi:hypothetical protein H4S07_000492 [Coemansia furcata]|uniref:Uncharacterized protein n=1 Tax=Coemansia furcata TaxID=417177 RepID=A0ACC1LS63_9FUNG|nr:hypothetical protein H4S07_000492 [Coemansia furcata]
MYVLTNLYPQDTVVNELAASEADDVWTGSGGSSDGALAWGSDSDNPPIAADKTDVLRNNDNTSFGRGGAPKPSDVTSAPRSSLVAIGLYTPNRRVRTSKSYNTSNARGRQPAFARRRPCEDALNQCSESASLPPPRVWILKSHSRTDMDIKDTARAPRKTVRFDIPPADDKHDTASIDSPVLTPRPGQLQAEHTDDKLKGGLSPRTANPSSSGNIASIEPKRPHFIYMDCPAIKVLLSDCLSANSILAGKSGRTLYHDKPTCVAIVSQEDSAHVEKRRGICLGRGLAGIARYYQPVRHKPEFPSLQRSKGRYRSLAALRTHRLETHLAKRYKKPTRSARRKRLDRLFANRSNSEHPASQSTGGEQSTVSSSSLVGSKRRKSPVTGVTNKKHHGGLVGSSPGGEQFSAPSSSAASDKRPTGQGPSGVDQKRLDGNNAGGKQPVVPNAGVMNDKRPAGQGASSTNSALANTQQVGWPTGQPSPGLSFGAGGTGTSASFTGTTPVFTLGKVTGQRGTKRLVNIHARRPTRVNGNRSFSLFGTARSTNGGQGSLLERRDMEVDSNGSNPVASLESTNGFSLGNFPNTDGEQGNLLERHYMEVDPNGYNPAASLGSTGGFDSGTGSNSIPISSARPVRGWTNEFDHANNSNPIPGLTTIPGSNSTANLGSTGGFDHAESSRSGTDFNPYYGF